MKEIVEQYEGFVNKHARLDMNGKALYRNGKIVWKSDAPLIPSSGWQYW